MKPGMTELGDLGGLQSGEMQVTTVGIRVMIRVEKEYPEVRLNRRIAIYSPEDLEFGMSKIYQNYEEIDNKFLKLPIVGSLFRHKRQSNKEKIRFLIFSHTRTVDPEEYGNEANRPKPARPESRGKGIAR